MKLYHCQDTRSLRPLWTIEEMELDTEVITMEFPPRLTQPTFLAVNPLGTVPAFFDGDLTMTESTAICQYLVEKYGPTPLAMNISEHGYGEYLNWLYRSDATLTFPQTLVLRYSRFEPQERRQPQVVKDYTQWYLSRLRAVESSLEGKEYLCGDRFTIADIAVGYALFLGETLGLAEHYKPNCKDYLARLMARPGFIRARDK